MSARLHLQTLLSACDLTGKEKAKEIAAVTQALDAHPEGLAQKTTATATPPMLL